MDSNNSPAASAPLSGIYVYGFVPRPCYPNGEYIPIHIVHKHRKDMLERWFQDLGLVNLEFCQQLGLVRAQEYPDAMLATFKNLENAVTAMATWKGTVINDGYMSTVGMHLATHHMGILLMSTGFGFSMEEENDGIVPAVGPKSLPSNIFEDWWAVAGGLGHGTWYERNKRINYQDELLRSCVYVHSTPPTDPTYNGKVCSLTYEEPIRVRSTKLDEVEEPVQMIDWAATKANGHIMLLSSKNEMSMFTEDRKVAMVELAEDDSPIISGDEGNSSGSERDRQSDSSPNTTPPYSPTVDVALRKPQQPHSPENGELNKTYQAHKSPSARVGNAEAQFSHVSRSKPMSSHGSLDGLAPNECSTDALAESRKFRDKFGLTSLNSVEGQPNANSQLGTGITLDKSRTTRHPIQSGYYGRAVPPTGKLPPLPQHRVVPLAPFKLILEPPSPIQAGINQPLLSKNPQLNALLANNTPLGNSPSTIDREPANSPESTNDMRFPQDENMDYEVNDAITPNSNSSVGQTLDSDDPWLYRSVQATAIESRSLNALNHQNTSVEQFPLTHRVAPKVEDYPTHDAWLNAFQAYGEWYNMNLEIEDSVRQRVKLDNWTTENFIANDLTPFGRQSEEPKAKSNRDRMDRILDALRSGRNTCIDFTGLTGRSFITEVEDDFIVPEKGSDAEADGLFPVGAIKISDKDQEADIAEQEDFANDIVAITDDQESVQDDIDVFEDALEVFEDNDETSISTTDTPEERAANFECIGKVKLPTATKIENLWLKVMLLPVLDYFSLRLFPTIFSNPAVCAIVTFLIFSEKYGQCPLIAEITGLVETFWEKLVDIYSISRDEYDGHASLSD